MKQWQDLGGGQWKLTVTADGDPTALPSVFRGTKDEILDKLADSQANANRRIADLRRTSNGTPPPSSPPAAIPRPLTAVERLETVAELQNPATVDKAITRVMESAIGPVEDFVKDRNTRTAVQAAEMFAERTPEWHPSEHNKQTLIAYMQTHGMNPANTLHYTQAFEALRAAQLLQPKPEADNTNDEPEAQERNAPDANAKPRTPTRYSTSIRSSDISGRPPVPSGKPHLKYTREQLSNLSAQDYKQLMMTDRAELERCESYYATRRAG